MSKMLPTDAMAVEMAAQPDAVSRLLAAYAPSSDGPVFFDPTLTAVFAAMPNLLWAACGSSLWAATLGAYAWAQLCQRACVVRPAHELIALGRGVFRGVDLCVLVSQSGETQDTLEALALAQSHKTPLLAIINAPGSQMATRSRWYIDTHAGIERAVPSTKGFMTQAVSALLVAVCAALRTHVNYAADAAEVVTALHALPQALRHDACNCGAFTALVDHVAKASQVFFLGRGPDYPIAAEGALKLMESTQLPAHGFAMGEFKHGPMACLDATTPVIAVVSNGPHTARTRQNLTQLRACGAPVWWIGPTHLDDMAGFDGHHIVVPSSHPLVAPLVAAAVLQKLAWRVAHARGLDPCAPRHLVKSVQQL